MTRDQCAGLLRGRYFPGAAADTDMVVALAVGAERIVYHLHPAGLGVEPRAEPDVTFTFSSWEKTHALLTGGADPIAAFMAGEFRSDGYLTAVFLVLSVFSRPDRPDVPN